MKSVKLNVYSAVAILITVVGFAPLCYAQTPSEKTSIKESKQETQELIQVLKAYGTDQRDAAIQKTKAALNNLDKRIDALQTRIDNNWDKTSKTAREKARARLKSLRQQRIQVAEWYGRLKDSSDDAWEHIKKGFSNAPFKVRYNVINI